MATVPILTLASLRIIHSQEPPPTLMPSTDRPCEIRIQVLDVWGEPQAYRVVYFTDQTGREFSQLFGSSLLASVPCGVYRLRLSPKVPSTVIIEVYTRLQSANEVRTFSIDPTMKVTSEGVLAVHWSAKGARYLNGQILSEEPFKGVWIRFRAIYREKVIDAGVDENGRFSVNEPILGDFSYHVIRDGTVLATGDIRTRSLTLNDPLIIKLGEKRQSIVLVK